MKVSIEVENIWIDYLYTKLRTLDLVSPKGYLSQTPRKGASGIV